ncbi:MAG: DNA integrity scanning diadenylate cyclase DisA [Acidimicrobiia bacterium]|nr:DNA integrity scanning diadenylate cyclase DisA [Acidimicrobiia bacterium]
MTQRAHLEILRALAPGTPVRVAIDLILRQGTGALVVLGYGSDVEAICSGGFHLNGADFSPARLAELAKMDGAVICDSAAEVIYRANVHLLPDGAIRTAETGTRHRTAERTAVQVGRPCIVISEGRGSVSVFTPLGKYELRNPTTLLAQANQNLLTLERFRRRLADAESRLTQLEVDDLAVYRDVVLLLQRAALVQRVAAYVEDYAVELGGEGDIIHIQVDDLLLGVQRTVGLVYADFARNFPPDLENPLAVLADIETENLSDPNRVAALLDFGPLDRQARSRGRRVLDRLPRLPDAVKDSLIERFENLQGLLHASVTELDDVEGVGRARARQLRNYFDRLQDTSHGWGLEED